MLLKSIIFLSIFTTTIFSIPYEDFNKKIQGLKPLLKQSEEYKENEQSVKFSKSKDIIKEYYRNIISNTKEVSIPCFFTFNKDLVNIHDLSKVDYKLYDIGCNSKEDDLSLNFIYYHEDASSYLAELYLNSLGKAIIESGVANYFASADTLAKARQDLEKAYNAPISPHLKNYLYTLQEFIKVKNDSIKTIENRYLETLEDLAVIIPFQTIQQKQEDSEYNYDTQSKSFSFKEYIVNHAQYTGTLSISIASSMNFLDTWLSTDTFYNSKSIKINAILKNISLKNIVIDDVAIPVSEIKPNQEKVLALKYFPIRYCENYIKTKYIEKENRCQTEEEFLIEKDPLAYCETKIGAKEVHYKADLKRCETIEERDIRLLKDNPNGYCEVKVGSEGVEYKDNLKRCETIEERDVRLLAKDPNGYCETKVGGKGVEYKDNLKRCETIEERDTRIAKEYKERELSIAKEYKEKQKKIHRASNIGFYFENSLGLSYSFLYSNSLNVQYNGNLSSINSKVSLLMGNYSLGLGIKLYKIIPLLRISVSTDVLSILNVRLGPSIIWDIDPYLFSLELAWFPVQYTMVSPKFLANNYGAVGNVVNTLGSITSNSGLQTSLYTVGFGIRVVFLRAMLLVSNKTLSGEIGLSLPVVFYSSEATCKTTVTVLGFCK